MFVVLIDLDRVSDDPIFGAFCIQKQILDNALIMGEFSYVS